MIYIVKSLFQCQIYLLFVFVKPNIKMFQLITCVYMLQLNNNVRSTYIYVINTNKLK